MEDNLELVLPSGHTGASLDPPSSRYTTTMLFAGYSPHGSLPGWSWALVVLPL
jgi:hypothetical protein